MNLPIDSWRWNCVEKPSPDYTGICTCYASFPEQLNTGWKHKPWCIHQHEPGKPSHHPWSQYKAASSTRSRCGWHQSWSNLVCSRGSHRLNKNPALLCGLHYMWGTEQLCTEILRTPNITYEHPKEAYFCPIAEKNGHKSILFVYLNLHPHWRKTQALQCSILKFLETQTVRG